jgi:glycosyltransferase involved in cell wall biosynthesis
VPDLISVIVPTYNREDALDSVLRALAGQSDRGFEVIVADDGSGPATAALIADWKDRLGVPLFHVWHEDRGFRAGEIRNHAILQSSGVYCVFLDGDCIPFPDFVARHRRLSEPGWFVAGNRVLLARTLSDRVLAERLQPERWGLARWIGLRARGQINRLAPLAELPLGPLRKMVARRFEGARSCNLAFWRADLMRVDGFDADFCGWGLEDSDIVIRLIRSGILRKDGRFATGVLHLWHPENDRSRLRENRQRLQEVIRSRQIRARRGLSSLRPAASAGGRPYPQPTAAGLR